MQASQISPRNAYNLVLHKHGDLLYTGIQETVRTRLRSVMEDVIRSPDDQLLSQVCVQWKEHQVTMVMVRDILMYMDRTPNAAFFKSMVCSCFCL